LYDNFKKTKTKNCISPACYSITCTRFPYYISLSTNWWALRGYRQSGYLPSPPTSHIHVDQQTNLTDLAILGDVINQNNLKNLSNQWLRNSENFFPPIFFSKISDFFLKNFRFFLGANSFFFDITHGNEHSWNRTQFAATKNQRTNHETTLAESITPIRELREII
jgi:hypothetical protein